jgi:hypothetical protein
MTFGYEDSGYNLVKKGMLLEDNQRVTYTYTVCADVIGLLSV